MFITVQNTPNKNSLKFIVKQRWMEFVWECKEAEEAKKSCLADALWQIDGVTYLMFGPDFVSVSKKDEIDWDVLQPEVIDKIADFFISGKSLFDENIDLGQKQDANKEYSEIEAKIIQVLEEKVQPALQSHGGMVKFISFKDGVLLLDMQGACKGCPSSQFTIKNGIENLMKYYFPEVISVESYEG